MTWHSPDVVVLWMINIETGSGSLMRRCAGTYPSRERIRGLIPAKDNEMYK